jgi:hypothetical protein
VPVVTVWPTTTSAGAIPGATMLAPSVAPRVSCWLVSAVVSRTSLLVRSTWNIVTFAGVRALTSIERRLTFVSAPKWTARSGCGVASGCGTRKCPVVPSTKHSKSLRRASRFRNRQSVSRWMIVETASSWMTGVSSTSAERPYSWKISAAMSLSFLFGQSLSLSSRSSSTLPSIPQTSSTQSAGSASKVGLTWVM